MQEPLPPPRMTQHRPFNYHRPAFVALEITWGEGERGGRGCPLREGGTDHRFVVGTSSSAKTNVWTFQDEVTSNQYNTVRLYFEIWSFFAKSIFFLVSLIKPHWSCLPSPETNQYFLKKSWWETLLGLEDSVWHRFLAHLVILNQGFSFFFRN